MVIRVDEGLVRCHWRLRWGVLIPDTWTVRNREVLSLVLVFITQVPKRKSRDSTGSLGRSCTFLHFSLC